MKTKIKALNGTTIKIIVIERKEVKHMKKILAVIVGIFFAATVFAAEAATAPAKAAPVSGTAKTAAAPVKKHKKIVKVKKAAPAVKATPAAVPAK
jgi:hypothetical protein